MRRRVLLAGVCGLLLITEAASAKAAEPATSLRRAEQDLQALQGAAAPEQRRALAANVRAYLNACALEEADLMLMISFADRVERLQMLDEARELYTHFAPRLRESPAPARRRIGELMTGALRRLDCVGQPFDLKGRTSDGGRFDIAALQGKVVLVLFWTVQGGDRAAHEELIRLRRDFGSRGLEIVGVNGDTDRGVLDGFLAMCPLPWPTLHPDAPGAVPPGIVHYGISRFPTVFLVGRDGRVLAVNAVGPDLRQRLIALLGPAAPRPIVSAAPGQTSVRNDMQDRIVDAGERWLAAGPSKAAAELMGTQPPPSAPGRWRAPRRWRIGDEEMYRRALDSVFVIGVMNKACACPHWHAFLATAFAVTADGVLCTSAHVFDFAGMEVGAVMAFNSAGDAFPVERVLALDPAGDTCLFRIAAKGLTPLPLADRAPVGARVRVVSHPGESVYCLSTGQVTSYERDEWDLRWMKISAEFGEGSSGAPVLDERGNVVGQVAATYTLYASGGTGRDPSNGATNDAPGEAQMVFRYCTPAERLRALLRDPAP
jgi:hypothetical protein